jgi:glucose/mannose-6-phosphate isomerase
VSGGLEPPFESRDPSGMAALIEGAPRQIDDAVARLAATPWRVPSSAPDLIAVGGMGGSAIAAELMHGLAADRLPRPMLVVRDYRWPACVTPASLAVLSSYSGSTEETLALYEQAKQRGIPRVAISTGGPLGRACDADGVVWTRLPGGMSPRAAVYASWVTWSFLLSAVGWIEDPEPEWREASILLQRRVREWGTTVPEERNPAKQMARALAGRFVFIYGGTERVGPVVTRLRHQINENAKLPAHSATAPELNHNEIVGWERPGPFEGLAAVLLVRDAEDASETVLRLTLTREFVEQRGARVTEIRETEGGRLARLASLVLFGDFVSFYLAMIGGVDPIPIASIDAFKRRLEQERASRAR